MSKQRKSDDRAKKASSKDKREKMRREPIAIVGIGCRFPGGANDPESYWKLLRDGVDAISEVPADRWNVKKYYDPKPGTPGKTNACRGGFVDQIDRFDAAFFGISPREATRMDPQQRVLLEVAWEAMEDAGMTVEKLDGSSTGVFVGLSSQDYMLIQQGDDLSTIDAHTNTGGAMSIVANRVSYCFNLLGPSIALDTACSSSLVAIHQACQSVWEGECEQALAGGVNILIKPEPYIGFSRLSMLSPDGQCRAFDAGANGFVRSEGAGIIVVKPLSKAQADGDQVYAVIRSTATNQDGSTPGLTVPSQSAQEELVREACKRAGVEPAQVQYVEAHGTGTLVGDPIEAGALGVVLGEGRSNGSYCRIGSVKTNIGHLEPAAGIAGIIKVALSLKHGEIPPNLHFAEPNPEIDFEGLKIKVPTKLEPWSDESTPLAGVNSFGFGGANAHALLEQAPPNGATRPKRKKASGPQLIPFSARSSESLTSTAQRLHEYLGQGAGADVTYEDIVWTATHRRSHHAQRLAITASNREELMEQLEAFADGQVRAGVATGRAPADQKPRIAFVCSGQGPQWWAMGRELLAKEPVFRDVIEKCDEVVRSLGPWSLLEELTADEDASRMQETSISQPAIFAVQVGLARLWESWGITPDTVVGHSVGEVAAAHLAGVFDLETATRVIYHRGRCMDFADAHGKMLAVGLPFDEAGKLVVGVEDKVSVAANNSPTAVTLSGDGTELERIAGELEERGIFNKFLRVNYAFHSPQMDPMKDQLLEALADIRPAKAKLPLYSTVSGKPTDGTDLDAEYWWRNVRQSVLFATAIDGLLEEGYDIFLELAPHPVLSGSVTEAALARGKKVSALHSLRRGDDEQLTMLKALGGLYTKGFDVEWSTVSEVDGHFVTLPTYAWQRESYWNESARAKKNRIGAIDHPLLGERRVAALPTWESQLDINIMRYLDDHRVQGAALLSATSYLEMALAAARELHGVGPYVIEEVGLAKACFLPEKGASTMQLVMNPDEFAFRVLSKTDDENEQSWTEHVQGKVRVYQGNGASGQVDVEEIRRRCDLEIGSDACYERMGEMGLNYGPTFQGVENLWCGRDEALGRIRIPEGLQDTLGDYQLHPAILDACFQVITGTLPVSDKKYGNNGTAVYLPVEFNRIRVFGRPQGRLWSHARLVERNSRDLLAEVRVLDDQGNVIADIHGFKCQAIEGGGLAAQNEQLDELVYRYEWQPKPLAGAGRSEPVGSELPDPAVLCEATSVSGHDMVVRYGLNEQRERLTKGINELCSAFLLRGFSKLGVDFVEKERFTTEELNDRLGVASATHRRLMTRCLQMLDEDGILTHEGAKGEETWEVVRVPEIGDPTEEWKAVFQQNPGFYAELTLLGRCAPQLAEIFSGEVDPLQLIFPDGSLALAEHMYQDSLSLRFYNTLTQQAVGMMVDALPEGRPIRVLEIGAGTGGLSSYVLSKLPPERTTYCYTDLSNHFFLKAQEKFSDFPFIDYKRLDIEQDPLEQGFEPHSFDLVLASECIHATADLRESVTNIKKLLASDGLMLLLEAVEPVRWVDLVFGLTEGWWRFTDTDLRKDHPLLSFDQWKGLLESCDFTDVQEGSGGEGFENAVVVARGPAVDHKETPADDAEASHEAGRWLIYADAGGQARALADKLEEQGDKCTLVHAGGSLPANGSKRIEIDPASQDDAKRMIDLIRADDGGPAWKGIVHMWNLDAPTIDEARVESLDRHMIHGCMSTIFLTQALMDVDAARCPRLYLVTCGAESIGKEPQETAAVQSSLWGLGRVIMNEVPKARAKLVDLDPAGDSLDALVDELLLDDETPGQDDDAIALRGRARYAHRYVRAGGRDAEARRLVRSDDEPYRLETTRAGTFDKLLLRSFHRRELEPGQVEIRVAATGLNFADVMKALGLYPGLPDGPVPLGIECSGRISAVADDVKDFKPGDEVVAIAPFSFGSYVTARAMLVAPKPRNISYEEAATLPVAYLTTHYAMNYLGRMAKGETVLVHSATGGVGLAAIQLAREAGAEVLATAGTPEKRDFLRSLGIEHVFDSRSLEFADQVLDATDGRGVDIVLNSLAGEGIRKGMNVLAPYGRFLEIGKRDIYANSKIGMRPFRKNLAFMAIDLDAAMREKPELQAALFREVMQKLDDGAVGPLPFRVFPASNVAGAFRYMAQAKHIGKVLVSFQEPEVPVAPAAVGEMHFRDDATYLMTGGLGGFGLAVAQWMVEQGARNLVLMGRSGASSDQAKEAVEAMRAAGANIVVAKGDVTCPESTAKVLADIDESMPPLRGVLHAAMVLKDRLLIDLNVERVREIWAPKVYGAWNLHDLTKDRELDFFALFSSLASVFGTGGQGNYASANAFLDSFASHLRAKGCPALTVSWGYVGEVGWVARHGETGERLENQGVHPFSPQQALQLFGRFIQDGSVHVGVMNMDWRQWAETALNISPRFGELVAETGEADGGKQASGSATRKALLAADAAERQSMMQELLREQVARVLGAAPDKLDVDRPLTDLGLDSLMAVELRNWVEGDLRLSLPTVELMRGPSVARLAEILLEQLTGAESGTAAPPIGEIPRTADDDQEADVEKLLAEVDDMPDEQVAALLAEMGSGSNEASR